MEVLKYFHTCVLHSTTLSSKNQFTFSISVCFGIKLGCVYYVCLYAQYFKAREAVMRWNSAALSAAWTQCICVWHSVFVTVMSSCCCGTLPHFSSDRAWVWMNKAKQLCIPPLATSSLVTHVSFHTKTNNLISPATAGTSH